MLGEAHQRSDAPERQMTYSQSCILRLLTHLAMLQGAIRNQRVRLHHILHVTGIEKMASCNNTVVFCCRELVTWSTPGPMMSSTSCGTTLKRTCVCWARRWIRTLTTRPLQFIWFSIPAQSSLQVILTFQRFSVCCFFRPSHTSLKCSGTCPAWDHVWMGAGKSVAPTFPTL